MQDTLLVAFLQHIASICVHRASSQAAHSPTRLHQGSLCEAWQPLPRVPKIIQSNCNCDRGTNDPHPQWKFCPRSDVLLLTHWALWNCFFTAPNFWIVAPFLSKIHSRFQSFTISLRPTPPGSERRLFPHLSAQSSSPFPSKVKVALQLYNTEGASFSRSDFLTTVWYID